MNTKYVKVPVSERLPEKGGTVLTDLGDVFFRKDTKNFEDNYGYDIEYPEYWYQEVPDQSEEMEEMLNEIFLELDSLWDHEHNNSVFGVIDVKKIAELLNKVKDNG